jgi:hypothetical protein
MPIADCQVPIENAQLIPDATFASSPIFGTWQSAIGIYLILGYDWVR